jgi:hypothetical protein
VQAVIEKVAYVMTNDHDHQPGGASHSGGWK